MDKPSVVPFVPRMDTGPIYAPDHKGTKRWYHKRRSSSARKSSDKSSKLVRWMEALRARQWLLIVVGIGFLLGRAVMLEGISPFAAAFFGVVLYLRKDMALWAAAALIAGGFWAIEPMPAVIAVEIGVIYLLYRGLVLYERADLSHAPVVVFASTLIVRLFDTLLIDQNQWLPYLLTLVEALLAFVLTLLFIHALPVLGRTKRATYLRHEEWIGIAILLACLLTGLAGWSIYGITIASVFACYFVLITAYISGPALGASAGVITGMLLGLSNLGAVSDIGLLAFGGLLAGLVREGGKVATLLGMLLGTTVMTLYGTDASNTITTMWTTLAAALFLLFTPRSTTEALARYIPGTIDYAQNQRDYAQKVRDLTAERIEKFSEVFRQLSRSFRQLNQAGDNARQGRDFDHFVTTVQERACSSCHRRSLCWEGQFIQTYKLMTDMMTAIEEKPTIHPADMPKGWNRLCVKLPLVHEVLKRQYEIYQHDLHWRQQLQDSRYLVADQLSGVSQVMDDLVKEIRREAKHMDKQEGQIRDALDHLGLAIQSIDIISLEEGTIEIEMVHAFRAGYNECRKMIAPILSEILNENISVRSERSGEPAEHLTTVTFSSAKTYEVETGVAGAAKDGDVLSGDSFSMLELGNGKFAVALSDGMGNGVRARMESSAALSMLEQLLLSGIDERLAVKSVNSVLLLRSPDEMFATVDLALIDLYTANATMLKIGSTPSFIKRGREIIPISANNLPIGILHEIEIDLLRIQLHPGDTLIMMTDGILDSPGHAINKELWMRRVLQELEAEEPQDIADALLDTALRQYPGGMQDDMTVIVTRLNRHQPEWAAFRWPGLNKMERPRTVS